MTHYEICLWCKKSKCGKHTLEKILNELPDVIGTKKFGGPYLDAFLKKSQHSSIPYTGSVTISESTIQVHTYPNKRGCFCIYNIFSCGEKADPRKVVPYLLRILNPKIMEAYFLEKVEK